MSQNIPAELKYTRDHEWAQISGNICTIGITDFAQSQLGDIVFVEIPEVGAELTAGETFGTVESVKTVSDLYAPVSGKVVEVNQALIDHPELVNTAPYSEGWMVLVEMATAEDSNELMDAEAYTSHLGE